MPMTVDEIRKELEYLSEEEKRLLLESLQSALNSSANRVSLEGILTGSQITEQDIAELRHWK